MRIAPLLSIILGAHTSCMTAYSIASYDPCTHDSPIFFGGTRLSLSARTDHAGSFGGCYPRPFFSLLDFPFSLIADTVISPITGVVAVSDSTESESRAKRCSQPEPAPSAIIPENVLSSYKSLLQHRQIQIANSDYADIESTIVSARKGGPITKWSRSFNVPYNSRNANISVTIWCTETSTVLLRFQSENPALDNGLRMAAQEALGTPQAR